jgi:hypothetical protein
MSLRAGRFLRREAIAIAIDWASAGIPEFADILRRITEDAFVPKDGISGGDYQRIISMIRFDPAQEDIAIDEVQRLRHLADPRKNSLAKSSP